MPRRAGKRNKNEQTPDHIDPLALALIVHRAQDAEDSILAGAQHLQSAQSALCIGTIYLRDPDNLRLMDRRIPVQTVGDGNPQSGPCKYSSLMRLYVLIVKLANKRATRTTLRPSLERPAKVLSLLELP